MREKKETRAAEVAEAEPVVGEIAPASAPPSEPKPAPPAVVVNSEQPEEVQVSGRRNNLLGALVQLRGKVFCINLCSE